MTVEIGQENGGGKKDDAQPGGDLRQDVSRAGAKKIFSDAAPECRAQSFLARALHQDKEDEQDTADDVDGEKKTDQDIHF